MSFLAICGRPGGIPPDMFSPTQVPSFGESACVAGNTDGSFRVIAEARSIARTDKYLVVGDAQLQNRHELLPAARRCPTNDLEVLAQALDIEGMRVFRRALGEFSVVVAPVDSTQITAVRDSLGVARLFGASLGEDRFAFSSRLSVLAELNCWEFDEAWVAGFMLRRVEDVSKRTVWKGIQSVTPGTFLTVRRGKKDSEERYWSPFRPLEPFRGTMQDASEEVRRHFLDAVRASLSNEPGDWCLLSGGLDSSSVVAAADYLRESGTIEHAFSGTVTFASTPNPFLELSAVEATRRDDREMVFLEDYWFWQGGSAGERPEVCPDQPSPWISLWALTERISAKLERSGCTSLHTGLGSDHYFSSANLGHIAELIRVGDYRAAARETLHRATATRQCFWPMLGHHIAAAIRPRTKVSSSQPMPRWLRKSFIRRSGLRHAIRESTAQVDGLRAFQAGRAKAVQSLSAIPYFEAPYFEGIPIRHPFLFRPLVEFAMTLEPRQLTDSQYRGDKAVLRHAMREILPDPLRMGSPNVGLDQRMLLSLAREGRFLESLLHAPLVAELGWVDAPELRRAVRQAVSGESYNPALLQTISIEAWLRLRGGKWPAPSAAREEVRVM